MSLLQRILAQIDQQGGISIADYMLHALADPEEGYYMSQTPLGVEGDFVTSPEISQVFGEMLGVWIAECWHHLGKPRADVVEMGPGLGTLMDDFLRATKNVAGFHDSIDVHMVETSDRLQSQQKRQLEGKHPRIHWHRSLPQTDRPLLIIGNEFFDALPIEQYITTAKGFRERIVVRGADEETLAFDVADKELRRLPTRYPRIMAGELPEGAIVETCPMAQEIMDRIARHISRHGGAALFIDYGYTRSENPQEYAEGDTLQAVRKHVYHDVLHEPGKADLTAHVDFSALSEVAVAAGGYAPPVLSQAEFLTRMGGELRMKHLCQNARTPDICATIANGYRRLIMPEEMGELFKVLAVMPAGIPAPLFTEPNLKEDI
jgi:SAM-dependent MidA family methyltransferase